MAKTVEVFAPAKINLTLHITGQRDDGYHLLDSLVAFADIGDRLTMTEADRWSISVSGPEAQGVPADESNLALKAAKLTASADRAASLELEKFLPPASGIGGGSSDAAAAFRGVYRLHKVPGGPLKQYDGEGDRFLALGADVPMCLVPFPKRVLGIGEEMQHVTLPSLAAVLVNPRIEVPTPVIFRDLEEKRNPPTATALPDFAHSEALIRWLEDQRNDLEKPAIANAPVIARVLEVLRGLAGCTLARMSGSGATCFGLFADDGAAHSAADELRARHHDWWIEACSIGDQLDRSMPRLS